MARVRPQRAGKHAAGALVLRAMDPARAARLARGLGRAARHRGAAVARRDARPSPPRSRLVPEPEAAAAITGVDGHPRIAALAGGALYLVWAVRGSAERARGRPLPPHPAPARRRTAVELSERQDPDAIVRHWWFELEEDPLVFRTTGDDEPERFARALAGALGWPALVL